MARDSQYVKYMFFWDVRLCVNGTSTRSFRDVNCLLKLTSYIIHNICNTAIDILWHCTKSYTKIR